MMTQTFTAVIHRENDWYVAECPETGTASQGETSEEALANLKEATEMYLEEAEAPVTRASQDGPGRAFYPSQVL
jgi:predicted RNase H-like HicB family nuclease